MDSMVYLKKLIESGEYTVGGRSKNGWVALFKANKNLKNVRLTKPEYRELREFEASCKCDRLLKGMDVPTCQECRLFDICGDRWFKAELLAREEEAEREMQAQAYQDYLDYMGGFEDG